MAISSCAPGSSGNSCAQHGPEEPHRRGRLTLRREAVMERRKFLGLAAGGMVALAHCFRVPQVFATEMVKKMTLSDKEWKNRLTGEQYDILRREGTEAPFTSPLLKEHRDGAFACVGCGLPLFLSSAKYDSGTGWPSFFDAIPGHVETKTDFKIGTPRTEYHCARCGGHHGHVFDDGPPPTRLRYCSNGAALKFIPKEAQ